MPDELWKLDWGHVDKTQDPEWFVRFLDESRKSVPAPSPDSARRFFGFLEVQEGHRVLDVGCGTGLHSQLLSYLVGNSGSVTGVDYSDLMIREASRRAEGTGLPVRFVLGDANSLDFDENTFDRIWAAALLQHLPDPGKAVSEMSRVLKPGRIACSFEHDWDTLIIDAKDHRTAKTIAGLHCDSLRNGTIGRQVPRLFREAGLADVTVTAIPMVFDNLHLLEDCILSPVGRRAVEMNLISESLLGNFVGDLKAQAEKGSVLWSFMLFRVTGTKL